MRYMIAYTRPAERLVETRGVAMKRTAEYWGATARYESAWGQGLVRVQDGLLREVFLPGDVPAWAGKNGLMGGGGPACEGGPGGRPLACAVGAAAEDELLARKWASELTAYFAGHREGWTAAELEVELEGLGFTSFARDVYRSLLATRGGETVGYGEVAQAAGYPRAARAVGSTMARNPLPIVIPCHRVVRASGELGRYGSDPSWKARLLALERGHAGRAARKRGE